MPFTVLNRPDAAYLDQAEPDSVDFQILGDDRFGVLSGGDATQQGSPNMTIAMSETVALVNGVLFNVPGGNVTIAAAEGNARFDLITVNSSGAWQVIKGTASTNARFPTWDRLRTVYHTVYVPAGATSVTNDLITDKRRLVEVTMKRRSTTGTDVMVDFGTFADGNKWLIDANGKMTWENGSTDLSISRSGADVLSYVGGQQVVTSADAVPTMVLKAKSGQTADLLQVQDASGNVIARIDISGNFSSKNFSRGSGSPEGVVTAPIGSVYQRTDLDSTPASVCLYVKEAGTGNTGWQQVSAYNPAVSPLPIGTIIAWAAGTPEAGFLELNGQAVSRSTYSALFTLWGATFGAGNGTTTFNLPDCRGRVLVGYHSGSGRFNANGKTGGVETVVLTGGQLPSVSFSTTVSGYSHDHGWGFTTTLNGDHTHSWYFGATPPGGIDQFVVQTINAAGYSVATAPGPHTAKNTAGAGVGGTIYNNGNHQHAVYINGDSHGHTVTVNGWPGANLSHENTQPYLTVASWLVKAL